MPDPSNHDSPPTRAWLLAPPILNAAGSMAVGGFVAWRDAAVGVREAVFPLAMFGSIAAASVAIAACLRRPTQRTVSSAIMAAAMLCTIVLVPLILTWRDRVFGHFSATTMAVTTATTLSAAALQVVWLIALFRLQGQLPKRHERSQGFPVIVPSVSSPGQSADG